MDNDEKRIAKVFDVHEAPKVCRDSLLKYRQYLLAQLDKDTVLTGREDFPWEEKYVFGYGNPAEYEQQKREIHHIATSISSSTYLKNIWMIVISFLGLYVYPTRRNLMSVYHG